ncbi:Serpin_1 [Hexamita inflata]|uniref:Serpin_1 n=1 Tax=Hexamita inflata TaxID=28002 RepID=A0ABP1HGF2_9EUKA
MLTLNNHVQKVVSLIDFTAKSTCYSPFSLMHALSILVKCSNDASIQELVSKLEFNELEMQELSQSLGNDSSVKLASNIFDIHTEKITKEFKELMLKQFSIVPENLVSAQQVNNWCAKHTDNRIKEIVDSIAGLDNIIVSAIHFKAQWAYQFDPYLTYQKQFSGFHGVSTVQMMRLEQKVQYGENEQVQVVRLPYMYSNLQALVILPTASSPEAFNAALSVENINIPTFEATTTLELPRFKIESTFNLKSTLQQLGIKQIFDQVDCTNTLSSTIQVQEIVQKTFIETNENGTEAAAVTGILQCACLMPEEFRTVECDRPFWFLIVNEVGGVVFATSVV